MHIRVCVCVVFKCTDVVLMNVLFVFHTNVQN